MSACNTERDDGCEWYFGVPFKSKRAIAEAEAVAGSELKVGDRVRGNGGYSFDTSHGEIVETPSDRDNCFRVRVDNCPSWRDTWPYLPDEIELLPPTFAKNTRVKLNRHVHRYAAGDTGTVTVSNDENVGVRMDRGGHWAFRPQDLAVVDSREPELTEAAVLSAFAPDCSASNGEQYETLGDILATALAKRNETKPKFKAGDVVKYDYPSCHRTIKCVLTHYEDGEPHTGMRAYSYVDGGWDYESSLVLVTASPCPQDNEHHPANDPSAPCIVMRLDGGAPRPSYCPHVHPSAQEATKEAERLATINPGKHFEVYQRVTGRVAEQHIEMKVA